MERNKQLHFLRTCFSFILLSVLVLALSGCASTPGGNEITLEKTTFSFDQDKAPFDLFPEYHIAPGDVLDVLFQIRTWIEKETFELAVDHAVKVKFVHNPELNQEQTIRPDGKISLPYLREVYIVGMTVTELTTYLNERYKNILKNPEIYVVIPEFRSAIKELKKDLHTAPRGLSRLVTVRPDGYVTFPMVGEVFVADKTISDVNNYLNGEYDKIVPGLHVDLFLERHSGSLIYIVGEVKKPGAYKIIKPISIVEALTLAGSHLPGAKLNSIVIVRRHEGEIVATRVDLKSMVALRSDSKFFYLQPDDIIYVPKTWISSAAEITRDIADILFFRGWGINLDFADEPLVR